jgi:hypothetical protein
MSKSYDAVMDEPAKLDDRTPLTPGQQERMRRALAGVQPVPVPEDGDELTDAEAREAIDAFMARKEAERVVARVDDADRPRGIELCRDDLPPELAAGLIRMLTPRLAEVSPDGAELVARIAQQIEMAARHAPHLPAEVVEQDRDRLRREHVRALDAARHVSEAQGERAAVAVEALRQAAKCLVPDRVVVPVPPSTEDTLAWRAFFQLEQPEAPSELRRRCFDWSATGANGWSAEASDPADIARSERLAVNAAFRLLPELRGKAEPAELIVVLRQLDATRPRAPRKNTAKGKRRWATIKAEQAKRKQAGLAPLRPIAVGEELSVCRPVLVRLGCWVGFDEAGCAAIDRAWLAREEEHEISLRDRDDADSMTKRQNACANTTPVVGVRFGEGAQSAPHAADSNTTNARATARGIPRRP